uniref:Uncharacterized protein n=1 Tax=Anguilla anguilla TaxID=7936 RepID=A0A0E9UIK3_ANGAN
MSLRLKFGCNDVFIVRAYYSVFPYQDGVSWLAGFGVDPQSLTRRQPVNSGSW